MTFRPRDLVRLLLLAPLLLASDCNDYDLEEVATPTGPSPFISLAAGGGFQIVDGQVRLIADGVSRGLITATLSETTSQRTIVFSTTAGTLVGGSPNTNTAAEVTTVGRQATIELQSSQQLVTARVQAVVKNQEEVADTLDVEFVPADAGTLIRFIEAPAVAPADGQTPSFFTVEISGSIPQAERTVSFITTAGSFDSDNATDRTATINVGAASTARITLYSDPAVGTAQLRATVKNTTASTDIRFERAFPDTLTVTLDRFTVTDTLEDEIEVTVGLLRDVGTVTDGTVVTLMARNDQSGNSFGTVSGDLASTGGSVTAKFSPAASGEIGRATLTVGVAGGNATASVAFDVAAP